MGERKYVRVLTVEEREERQKSLYGVRKDKSKNTSLSSNGSNLDSTSLSISYLEDREISKDKRQVAHRAPQLGHNGRGTPGEMPYPPGVLGDPSSWHLQLPLAAIQAAPRHCWLLLSVLLTTARFRNQMQGLTIKREARELLGMDPKTVRRQLKDLESAGVVRLHQHSAGSAIEVDLKPLPQPTPDQAQLFFSSFDSDNAIHNRMKRRRGS